MAKFDFEPELHKDFVTRKLDFVYRPYLFLQLKNSKKSSMNRIKALVDSGSDHNIFPSEFASEIGLKYKTGRKHVITAVNEYSVLVYGSRITIEIGAIKIETIIYFGENVKIPVLGRDGFFNYFKKVAFNVKGKTFELI